MVGRHNGGNVNLLSAQIAKAVFVLIHSVVADQGAVLPIQLGLNRRHQGKLRLTVFLVPVVAIVLYRLT